MKEIIGRIKGLFEIRAFGVCSTLGDQLGIASSRIRLFFVYLSFLTLGSPIIIYLSLAFLINIGRYIRNKRRNPVWDF